MEANKSKCLDCGAVYTWTGFKTGLGKTKEQLLEMSRKDHTCRHCGSKMLITGLSWDGYNDAAKYEVNERYNQDPSVLTEREQKRHDEDYREIDTTVYTHNDDECKDFVVITTWEDSDGKWIMLYCKKCKERFVRKEEW